MRLRLFAPLIVATGTRFLLPAAFAADHRAGLVGGEHPIDLTVAPGELQVVPSFITCSYYFRPVGTPAKDYFAEFRREDERSWHRTLETVCDLPAGVWKGSAFGLTEDGAWRLRITPVGSSDPAAEMRFRTWSSHPPIAKVIDLSTLPDSEKGGIVISDQGSPEGWIKYVAPAGWTAKRAYDPQDPHLAAITFQHASYVILENVRVVGGWRYGILVDDSNSVRVLNCEVSGWGRMGVQQFTNDGMRGKYLDPNGDMINLDGGIEINRSWGTVVERCYVHDPRHRANSWMFSHPSGPEAMHVNYARGGTVLRWNDFIGSDEHRWNDVIESSSNSSQVGGFYRDSDITGNFLTFGNDDGIELEGGGMNVRFYGNKVEGTTCGVSTGAGLLGPQYVLHNLVSNLGDESGMALYFFKNSHQVPQGGKRYFINNTLYGFDDTAYGNYGKGLPTRIGFSRNNIFLSSDCRAPESWMKRDDIDDDLFWTRNDPAITKTFVSTFQAQGQEKHVMMIDPQLVNPDGGDYHLGSDSPARERSVPVTDVTVGGEDLGGFTGGVDELPFRPLAMQAIPRQLKFENPANDMVRTVTVSLPATAREPVSFLVRKNDVFTWFSVEPSEGTLQPGQAMILTVTVDPTKIQGRPMFKGAFIVRTPEGLSRPVLVYARPDFKEAMRPSEAPDSEYIAAADIPALKPNVRTTGAPSEVGGKYVPLKDSPEFEFGFDVKSAGENSLLLRTSVEGDVLKKCVMEVSVDGKEPEEIPLAQDFQWNVGNRRFRVVYFYAFGQLAAGHHQVRIKPIQGQLDLNELIVTDNPSPFFSEGWQRAQTNSAAVATP